MSENVELPIDDLGINCEEYDESECVEPCIWDEFGCSSYQDILQCEEFDESECVEPCIWDEFVCTYSYKDIVQPNDYYFDTNSNVPSKRRRKRIINPNIPRTHFPATKSVRKNFKTPSSFGKTINQLLPLMLMITILFYFIYFYSKR